MAFEQDIQSLNRQEILTNKDQYKDVSNKYNINVYQYPEDLGSAELSHYILFNINVRGKSFLKKNGSGKLGNEKYVATVVRGEDSAQISTDNLARAGRASGVLVGAAAGAAVPGIVDQVKGFFTNKQEKTGSSKGTSKGATVAGAVIGGLAGTALSFTEMLEPDKTYRISDTIALYTDAPPTVKYNAQYSNKDLGTLAQLVGGVSSVDSFVKSATSPETLGALGMQLAKVPQMVGLGAPADIIGAAAKVAINPFKEVLFESIDFRTFGFKYRFFPKSLDESNEINEIIKRFKFHMHPDISDNKLFMIYPSEFEIGYYFQGQRNKYFHKFKPCVLENMEVSYGGDSFSTFKNGYPTEVNMSLTFRETEILTKQQIKNGY